MSAQGNASLSALKTGSSDSFASEKPGLAAFGWVFGGTSLLLGSAVGAVVSAFFSGAHGIAVFLFSALCAGAVGAWQGRRFYFGAVEEWVRTFPLESGDAVLQKSELEALIRGGLPRAPWGALAVPLPRVWVFDAGGPAVFGFRAPGSPEPQIAVSRSTLVMLRGSELRELMLQALLLALRDETPRYTAAAALALRLGRWTGETWVDAALGGEKLGPVSPEGFFRFLLTYPLLRSLLGSARQAPAPDDCSRQKLAGAARLQPSGRYWPLAALSLAPLTPEKIVLSPRPEAR